MESLALPGRDFLHTRSMACWRLIGHPRPQSCFPRDAGYAGQKLQTSQSAQRVFAPAPALQLRERVWARSGSGLGIMFQFPWSCFARVLSATGLNLHGSQPILVRIVSIGRLDRQRTICVTLPTASEVDRIENAPDFIIPADSQGHTIVLAIAHIRKPDAAQHRCVKGAGSSEAVNAKCVIAAVLSCPFAV